MSYLRTPLADGLLALALLAPFMAWGCGSSSGSTPPALPVSAPAPAPAPSAPTTRHVYPASFVVPDVPPGSWVRADVYVCTAAVASFVGGLAEVDSTSALRDARIAWPATATVGIPTGWRLIVHPPAPSIAVYRDGVTPTQAVGITLYGSRTIHVALPTRARPTLIPVLAHELGHAHLAALGFPHAVADANDHPLTPIP